ncbi:MAG: efflux RND transporter permease subunit [Gammaproteobacteria bacterium]|nr:efflux RND transporter permease subunit [Gammaproteobacteria bacterium]
MAKRPARFRSRRPAWTHAPLPISGEPPLGLAGGIARLFINSPLSPLLLMVTLLVGLLGLLFTPRQEDPEISVPMVDIFVRYPGVAAQQVAALAIRPLERMMSEIVGVKHVYSASRRGEGMVTVRFKVGEKLGPSIVKVHDKLQSNLDRMPPGIAPPLVKPKGIDDVPVVTITLWSERLDDSRLRELAVELLQRLEAVPNTGSGFVVGGRAREIRIEVAPERLAGYGVSLETIANTVRGANGAQSGGYLEQRNGSFKVTSGAFLRDAESVGALIVGNLRGSPVYLRDLANVFEAAGEARHLVSYHSGAAQPAGQRETEGASAVTLALAKKEGSNGVAVAREILHRLEGLKGRLLPDEVEVAVTRNYGKTANDKVNELLAALLGAAVAVSLLCWFTIGARPALVVIIVIPVVILITIWSAWVLGYTINRVSLFALIFAIGILVDDATVVVENIFRRWLHDGVTSSDVAVDAVREVGNPTIIATLTVLAALLPMGFVSGMMGPYMLPIPLLASVAMSFSLIAAFVFTPWFAMRLRPKLAALQSAEAREHRIQAGIGRYYRPLIEPLVKHRRLGQIFLWSIVVAFFWVCSLFYTQSVTVKMLPFDNKPEFGVLINLPEGSALPLTANLTQHLVRELALQPEVTALQAYVGTASPFNFNGLVRHYYLRGEPWEADIQVMLTDKNERTASSHQLAERARALLTPIARRAGARIAVVEMPPGPPVLQTVVAEIYGPDAATRRRVAEDMMRMMEAVPNLVDVDSYMTQAHARWHFQIDSDKAIRRGVTVETINRNIEMAMGGYRLGDVKRGGGLEPTYLLLQLPLQRRSDLARLSNLPIPHPAGESVPLHELGRFLRVAEDPVIYHKDLRPLEYVTGEMEGRLGAPIYGMLAVESQLEGYTAPDGVAISGTLSGPPEDRGFSAFEWSGEWVVTYETFRDMGLAFAAALVLIYILLVWEFRNFIQPAIIMAPIPLTLIGIIPGHWLLGAEFTATSMIGFIALAGIEVRNSILLVDFAKNEVDRGIPVREAVIMAGHIRMRPIWVTDLTMMAGAFAILFDPIFQGMAISLLFGPVVATSLTLIVVPLGCITAGEAFCPGDGVSSAPQEVEESFPSTSAEAGG